MASRTGSVIIQLVLTYFVIAFIVRAIRKARKASAPPAGRPSPERRGVEYETPGVSHSSTSPASPSPVRFRREERMYNGVVWQMVHRPHRDLSEGAGSRTAMDEVYVEEPPRCPKCGLGVLETHSWLGYKWACPECGTRARSSTSIEETARLLAHRR